MMLNKTKTIYLSIALAVALAFVFVGTSNSASAQFNWDESYYDDGYYGYGDDYYDNSCYDCYEYGYSDPYYYDDSCYDCYAYDDYSYGYSDPYYYDYGGYDSNCDYGCGNGGGYVIDIYNNNTNTNTNTNINYGGGDDYVYSDPALTVSCYASDYSIEEGDDVTWYADASGGNGSYSYLWSGSSPLGGRTGSYVNVEYTSNGTKSGSVRVTSGNKTITADCGDIRVENEDEDEDEDDNNFDVSCRANPRNAEINERVTWTASTDGVDESKVDFDWSGDADGDDEEVTERYDDEGTYKARVRAEYKGDVETATCTVEVEDDGGNGNVTLISNPPTGTPASLSSVYLSQVPYTGANDKFKVIGYILSMIILSAIGAYYYVSRKVTEDRKMSIANFKAENLARKS